ncbi:hypothetical protein HPB48_013364 [Haemaphysalis longicornis]|uniref:Uncharacterized protein n=1 Tax=Haemaphysalis longicornis TaxID=44386 RepID=A0A9J6FUP3_HAELO|nr:hypothetical protein HPB48_013364 [Haemaphysalis longicornis]
MVSLLPSATLFWLYSCSEVKPLVYHACLTYFPLELHKKLKSSQGRKRVVEGALNGLCTTDNFVVYRHSPPKMLKACNFILENYRDELESSLHSFYKKYKVKDNLKLQAEFCDKTIKVCLPGQRDIDIRMNPVGMNIDEANQKLSEDLGFNQETVAELSRDEL